MYKICRYSAMVAAVWRLHCQLLITKKRVFARNAIKIWFVVKILLLVVSLTWSQLPRDLWSVDAINLHL